MATPHHLPALPTAAPVKVEVASDALVQGELSSAYLLERVREVVARGERLIQLVVPQGLSERRLGLAAALDIGGPVLVLSSSAARRNAWRSAFERLGRLDRAARAGAAVAGTSHRPSARATSLTALTTMQLRDLLGAPDRSPALDEPPLRGLSVLLVDSRRLRARAWEAIQALLERNTASVPVVLVLGGTTRGPVLASRAATGRVRLSTCSHDAWAANEPPALAPGPHVPATVRRLEALVVPGDAVHQRMGVLRARRVFDEPTLLVRSGRLVPYQELDWLAAPDPAALQRLAQRRRAALAIIEALCDDDDAVPGLKHFVAAQLPGPEAASGSVRGSWLEALASARQRTLALVRVHLHLGASIPRTVAALLKPLLEPARAPYDDEWARVLASYQAVLTLSTQPSAAHQRRLRATRNALARLGFAAHGPHALTTRTLERLAAQPGELVALLAAERDRCAARPLRAVVLTDAGDEAGMRSVARTLSKRGVPCAALTIHGLWLAAPLRDAACEQIARPLAAELGLSVQLDACRETLRPHSACDDDEPCDAALSCAEWAGAALQRGLLEVVVCTPDALALLASVQPGLCGGGIDALIDARSSAGDMPLPLVAAPLLRCGPRPRPAALVNLWRVHALGPAESHRRGLLQRIRADEHVGAMSGDGRIQYGNARLRDLLELPLDPDAPQALDPVHVEAFNRRALRQAGKHHLMLERWRILGGTRRRVAVEVTLEHGGQPRTALAELQAQRGAQMSERRARYRLQHFVATRRSIVAQALVAAVLAALLLPTLAGPILGSLVALTCAAAIARDAWRRQWANRLRQLHRPASTATVVRDIACVVLRSLRSCQGIRQMDLPTSSIRCSPTGQRRICIWLEHGNERLAQQFAHALAEALQPVGDERYIIGRPQTRVPACRRELRNAFRLHVASYHPVPTLFGARRERAEIFAGHWAQVFGPGRLRYTAGGKGRLLRYACYARNHLGVRARRVTTLV